MINYQCYYCKFSTNIEEDYVRHGAFNHLYKPMFPNEAEMQRFNLKSQNKKWEKYVVSMDFIWEKLGRWAEKRIKQEEEQKQRLLRKESLEQDKKMSETEVKKKEKKDDLGNVVEEETEVKSEKT